MQILSLQMQLECPSSYCLERGGAGAADRLLLENHSFVGKQIRTRTGNV